MNKLLSSFLLLALAGCIILVSGYSAGKNKVFWSGDETISYLCATGNQENFSNVALQSEHTEVNAAVWKNLFAIKEPYCFEKIATELSISDLHPPLYFWLLHLYILIFGVSLYAGIVLNTILHLISLLALFVLAKRLNFSSIASAIICLLWAVSPAALNVDFYARQYALLGLVNLLYAVCYLGWMQKPTRINILGLVVCCSLGFLTHYSFIYTVGGYFIFTLFNIKKIGIQHTIALFTSFLVAAGFLYLFHPHFLHQFVLQQQRAQVFEIAKLIARIGKTALTFVNFFTPVLLFKQLLISIPTKILLIIGGLIAIGFATFIWLKRNAIRQFMAQLVSYKNNISFPAFMGIWISIVSIIPYLFFITPFHAMGAQYLVCLYPFMAILLYKLISNSNTRIIAFACFMLLGSCVSSIAFIRHQASLIPLSVNINEANYIVCDLGDRRNIGRIVPYLNNDQIITIENPIELEKVKAKPGHKLVLITTYEKPKVALSANQQYYDFTDWGGFVVMNSND
jgi:hypothetical protein